MKNSTPLKSNLGIMLCMLVVVSGGWGYLSWAKARPYPSGSLREVASPLALQPAESRFTLDPISSQKIPGPATDLIIDGTVLYVAMTAFGMATLDISDPGHPVMTHHVEGSRDVNDTEGKMILSVHPEPDRLLVVDRQLGLSIYDNSDPLRPKLDWIKILPGGLTDRVVGIERVGDYYYLACGGAGLRKLKADFDEDTEAPAVLDFFDHTREATFLPPHWLLVTDGERSGFQILDVSDPSAPRPVGMMQMPGLIDRAVIFGDYAAVVARPFAVHIVNLKDPTRPFVVNWHERLHGSLIRSVNAWKGRYLLIGNRYGYIEVLDMKNPEEPVFLDQLKVGGDVKAVTIKDDLLYVGFWDKSLLNVYRMSVTEG